MLGPLVEITTSNLIDPTTTVARTQTTNSRNTVVIKTLTIETKAIKKTNQIIAIGYRILVVIRFRNIIIIVIVIIKFRKKLPGRTVITKKVVSLSKRYKIIILISISNIIVTIIMLKIYNSKISIE